jgi:hypothetical protein
LDPVSWKQIGENVKRAYQRGENIPIHFFGMWSSIHYCLGPLSEPSKEAHESSLPENNKTIRKIIRKTIRRRKSLPHKNMQNLNFPLWRILHHLMLAFTHHWPHFRLILRPVPYLRQKQNGERKMKKFPWKQLSGKSYWRMGIMTLLLHLSSFIFREPSGPSSHPGASGTMTA